MVGEARAVADRTTGPGRLGRQSLYRWFWIGVAVVALGACSGHRLERDQLRSTVRILCGDALDITSASGMVLANGEYILTNWHVVDCVRDGGRVGVVVDGDDNIRARVIDSDEQRDIALLEVLPPLDLPTVAFASRATVSPGDAVTATGFPRAADVDPLIAPSNLSTPSLTRGTISRIVSTQSDTRYYQIDAPINPGNSGGPVYDRFGSVIGISSRKPQVARRLDHSIPGLERIAISEGIGFALQIDEALALLDRHQVNYRLRTRQPSALFQLWQRDPLVLTALLAALMLFLTTLLLVVVTHRGRAAVAHMATMTFKSLRPASRRRLKSTTSNGQEPLRPILKATKGPLQGTAFRIGDGPVTIGRDPRRCQVVLPSEEATARVGRTHCVVYYDAHRGLFVLEDCRSKNGTFVVKGATLRNGKKRRVKADTQFYLGDPGCEFQVMLVAEGEEEGKEKNLAEAISMLTNRQTSPYTSEVTEDPNTPPSR